jgi:hypothetical protein
MVQFNKEAPEMRAIIILTAVVVLGGIAWLLLGGQSGEPVTEGAVAPAAETATEATEEAATTAAEEAGAAVEAAGEEAAAAVEGAVESATDAANTLVEQANEAADAAAEAASDAVEAATDAVEGAAGAAAEAVEGAADAVTGTPAADGASLADALSPEGFDADRVRTAIEESQLSAVQKQAALALVESAEQNPDLVPSVIDQLKSQLGL